jgi:Tol biopolymer transport system component
LKKYLIIAFLLLSLCLTPVGRAEITQEIVFSRNINGNWDIWTYNPENGKLRQITNTPEDDNNPIWLKDKQSLAYIRHGDIYIYRDGLEKRLTNKGRYRFISYDYINNLILCSVFKKSEKGELGSLDPQSGKEKLFLKRDGQQFHPKVSPDGKLIYYTNGYLLKNVVVQEISVLDRSTRKSKTLYASENKAFFRPDPCSDGKKIVFVSNEPGNTQLCIGDLETGVSRKLDCIKNDYCDYPRWSRDGNQVLYTALISGKLKLVVCDLDTEKNQVIDVDGDCKEADW